MTPASHLPRQQIPVSILNQLNPVPNLPFCYCKLHFNIILAYTSGSSNWSISFRFSHQTLKAFISSRLRNCSKHYLTFLLKGKGKGEGKVHSRTGHEGTKGEKRYRSTLSLTSAPFEVGVQRHDPVALPPGKTRYPLYGRLGRPQGRSGRLWNISPPPGFDPRTVQPVASYS